MTALRLTLLGDAGVVAFTATTPEQLVGRLWRHAYIREATPWQYMREVSNSVRVQFGHTVRTDTARHFIQDLEAAGLVIVDWGTDQ
jgi:hypothetical protein